MKIQIKELLKKYAGDIVFEELDMEIIIGSKVAIVGENGSGKSTLLKILSGIEPYDNGDVFIPKGIRVGYMRQVFPQFHGTTREYIQSAFIKIQMLANKLDTLANEMTTSSDLDIVLEKYAKAQTQYEAVGGYDFENTLESIAKGLGIYQHLDSTYTTLSGGEKTRVALAQLLLSNVDVLCLGEPTNHLDFAGISWLEKYCQTSKKTLVVVSHDRKFISNVASIIHEIEDSRIVTYHGSFESYRKQKKHRFIRLVEDFKEQQKQIQKLKIAIRRYRQWGNESDNEDFFKRAKTLEKRLEKIEKLPKPIELKNRFDLTLKVKNRSGKEVVVANDLGIGYESILSANNNFVISWKDTFAIVGDNGKGKSTLIKTIMNEIRPLQGTITVGPSVKIGYLAQQLSFKNEEERILEYIMYSCTLSEEDARRHLVKVGFFQEDTYKPIKILSGGERVRLTLLEIMLQDINLLILDEPTNHLDLASCEIIEEIVSNYEGTIIVVSHDRYFLEAIDAKVYQLN